MNLTETRFERAIFFSWHCDIRDCKYCYMSTQKTKKQTIARRSTESLLAETFITKKLGWDLGFFSGGIGAFNQVEFLELLKKVSLVYGEKIWINIGPIKKQELEKYKPYIKGVVGSIETVNEEIHDNVCPSKPIQPYLDMFEESKKLGLKNAITIIIGLGETIKDFEELKNMIEKYEIEKIHFYSLNPQKGTIFENTESPAPEYQAEWISKTRQNFPNIDIQCGIWEDKTDRVAILLKAGANSISKFPALKYFNSKEAKQIEEQANTAGRIFKGSLTKLPKINWDEEVDKLEIEKELKEKIKIKVKEYIKQMSKNK
jgi:biotin synthase-like enzyme